MRLSAEALKRPMKFSAIQVITSMPAALPTWSPSCARWCWPHGRRAAT
ncbi:hypothetical protein ACFPRL_21275 [Pseudoclavibacter helvolus]